MSADRDSYAWVREIEWTWENIARAYQLLDGLLQAAEDGEAPAQPVRH
jgi:hypothetical protein